MYDSSDEEARSCCLKGLVFATRDSLFPKRTVPKEMFRPPPPTYSLGTDSDGNHCMLYHEKYLGLIYESWKERIECSTATTTRGNKIACMMFRPVPNAQYTILYSHGNSTDMGADLAFCMRLGVLVDCNVFSYDYSGYGSSTGTPSQKNVLADIGCAWTHLRTHYDVLEERVILYGRSLGTIPTIELAAKKSPAGVILLSPLTSAKNVAIQNLRSTRNRQQFQSIDKLSKVTSPILVIHGVNDRVINLSHSVSIYNRYPGRIDALWVPGAGHEDIQFNLEYLQRMRKFATEDLGVSESKENLKAKIDQLRRMNLYF